MKRTFFLRLQLMLYFYKHPEIEKKQPRHIGVRWIAEAWKDTAILGT